MADPDFDKLVQDFAARSKKPEADIAIEWDEIKRSWIKATTTLYDQVDAWLQSLIESGSVKSSRRTAQAGEDELGPYEIPSLTLQVGGKDVTFLPVGTLLLGALGRIEVSGPFGRAALLLMGTDGNVPAEKQREHGSWFIAYPLREVGVVARGRANLTPWTRESFQQTFADLLGIKG